MGLVRANITIVNEFDNMLFLKGELAENRIRKIEVDALVDSGAYMLVINEVIKSQLGLLARSTTTAELADGSIKEVDVVGPVEVIFENRRTICEAMVMPSDNEVLLGAIPKEAMDVLVHPKTNRLIVNPDHPYQAVIKLK